MAGATNRVANQGVWIGAGFASEDATSLFLPGQLGMVVIQADQAFQLVQFDTTANGLATVAAGCPMLWKTPASFLVTNDYDVSSDARNKPAGIALLANTAGNYGWIQVQGPSKSPIITDSGNAGIGATLIYAAVDGQVTGVAAGTASTYEPFAIASAAEATGKQAGTIICQRNGW